MLRALSNPPNPWSTTELEYLEDIPPARLSVFEDASRTILSKNDEALVGFRYGLNPYRGCVHACAYCEARRRHELLGFGAGTDFDTKIVVKPRAPELLREAFDAASWKGDVVVFSGATDCYQPLEASYRLTRRCLEVCVEYRNPVAIVTKGALVERDLDLLVQLRDVARATVSISIPFWDPEVARALEPFVPKPSTRMRTVKRLAGAGIEVGVSVAPMILGLGEEGLADLLAEAKASGAARAVMSFLRLPEPVDAVFAERLEHTLPLRAKGVLSRVGDRGRACSSPRAVVWVSRAPQPATTARTRLPQARSRAARSRGPAPKARSSDRQGLDFESVKWNAAP